MFELTEGKKDSRGSEVVKVVNVLAIRQVKQGFNTTSKFSAILGLVYNTIHVKLPIQLLKEHRTGSYLNCDSHIEL